MIYEWHNKDMGFPGGAWSHISTRWRKYQDKKGRDQWELIIHPFDRHFGQRAHVDLAIDLLDAPKLQALFSGFQELEQDLTPAAPLMRRHLLRVLRRRRCSYLRRGLVEALRASAALPASPGLQALLRQLEEQGARPCAVTFAGTPLAV